MKEYIVQEMFDEKEGTKFKDKEGNIYIIKNRTVSKVYDCEERELLLNKRWFETKFTKVQEPVSFEEAINAGLEGKMIKVDHYSLNDSWNNIYFRVNKIFELLSKATLGGIPSIIKEGEWYIEE